MRPRKEYGTKNCIGRQVYLFRIQKNMKQKDLLAQLQIKGIDITQASLSDLEGQWRCATDREVKALAEIFHIAMESLFPP